MPIPALDDNRWPYTGDGVTVTFGFDSAVFADTDLKVYDGDALKVLGVDYTVARNPDRTGAATFMAPPAVGAKVLLVRDVAASQSKSFPAFAAFPAEQVTEALDKLTVLVQQLGAGLARKLGVTDTDGMAGFTLPAIAARAGKLLGFTDDGEMVASNKTIAEIEAGADTAAAQAAIATAAAGTATTQAGVAATQAGIAANQAAAAALSADEAEAALAGVLAYSGAPVAFTFDGDGVTVAYDLPVTPPTPDALALFVGGLYSRPPAWSLAGRTVTFSSAPPAGARMVTGFVGARGITLDAESKFQVLAEQLAAHRRVISLGIDADQVTPYWARFKD